MRKLNTPISILYNEAQKSILDQQLAAGLINGSKLVSKPFCNSSQNTYRGSCCGSLHAEARAIINHYPSLLFVNGKWNFSPRKKQEYKKHKNDIVVIRINRSGETCNARPCYNCLNMMKVVGIRRVYYSISPDKVIYENVKDMVSIQISSVNRYLEFMNGYTLINDSNKYFHNLLLKYFPSSIKLSNLKHFIDHNLINVLPTYKAVINYRSHSVCILDDSKNIVIKSNLIYDN